MKCFLGISNSLEEISSLSHSIVFLYFIALITEEDFFNLPLLFFGTLHDGVITHLEPDILECEVKCTLGNTTTNKASVGDGIPVELFQNLKYDAVKVLHSI